MRKIVLVLLIILTVFSITHPLTHLTIRKVEATPKTLIVPDDYPTIQAAIDDATQGDTIFVRNGTYRENLVVYKSVSLVGEDKNSVIIDGDLNGTVITVTADNVTIQNFTIKNSGKGMYDSGILVNNSTNVNIIQNIVWRTLDGIRLNFSDNNVISGNKIFLSSFGGIVIASSADNMVSNNNISGCQWGIYMYASNNNFILNNMLSENFYGIYLYSSINNLILGNTVSFNYQVGIYITFYSGNNTFYHNNLENVKNVQNDMINVWDFEGEGNYWNDYNGADLNEDGIGDTPHILDEKNQDNYPLMGTFSVFNIAVKSEEYNVVVISNSTISNFDFKTSGEVGHGVINFIATGLNNTWGFCRIRFSKKLIAYPYVVLINELELIPREVNVQNETYTCLYFDYPHNSSISIFFSDIIKLYYELLDNYLELQKSFSELNSTYSTLLQADSSLSESFTKLQEDFKILNSSFSYLNQTLDDFVESYTMLLENYTRLLQDFETLSYNLQELSKGNSEQTQRIQDLVYVLITTSAMFILAIIYLSKQSSEFKLTGEDTK